ncbi:MAG: TIGR03085 family metal-binding protein [Acidimicrobiales bacterium]
MPAPSLTFRERLALCDLFEELGPGAPTLCESWETADLAAHLVVRENDPRAAPGILLGGTAARLTERAMERARGRGFHWMVDRLRGGPPWGPMRLGVIDRADLIEWFVHHEDVRRADGRAPRAGIDDVDEALWTILRTGGRFITRRLKGIGLELRRPDGASIGVRGGDQLVRMVGRPSELVMFLTGRGADAGVELEGAAGAVESLRSARLGI